MRRMDALSKQIEHLNKQINDADLEVEKLTHIS